MYYVNSYISYVTRNRNQNAQSQNNWWHLFSIPGAILTVILTATSWGLMLTCYYGTLLNIRSFGREYLYFTTPIAGKYNAYIKFTQIYQKLFTHI